MVSPPTDRTTVGFGGRATAGYWRYRPGQPSIPDPSGRRIAEYQWVQDANHRDVGNGDNGAVAIIEIG